MDYTLIDVFCGCGGMSLGFERAGFTTILGIDNELPQAATFAMNRPGTPVLLGDIREMKFDKIAEVVGRPTVLAGGPPCQGFSSASNAKPESTRSALRAIYFEGIRALGELNPTTFLFENSPLVVKFAAPIERALQRIGRKATFHTLKAADFGVPQIRRRAFLTDTFVDPPKPHGKSTSAAQAIEGLGPPREDHPDEMHRPRMIESMLIARIKAAKPGEGLYGPDKGWTYKRLLPDRPTMSVNAAGEFAHWTEDRVFSFREYLRLQQMPDEYKFHEASRRKLIARILPPPFGQVWAEALKSSLEARDGGEEVRESVFERPGDAHKIWLDFDDECRIIESRHLFDLPDRGATFLAERDRLQKTSP